MFTRSTSDLIIMLDVEASKRAKTLVLAICISFQHNTAFIVPDNSKLRMKATSSQGNGKLMGSDGHHAHA